MKVRNLFKNDPFLRTAVVWGIGLLAMMMTLSFAMLQLIRTYDQRVASLVPFLLVLFGAAYMVKFIGSRPMFYTAVCGATVGIGEAFLGLLNELLQFNGVYYESFVRFGLVALVRGLSLGLVGALAGWIMTRGRVPIAIELPTRKEEEAAMKEGQPLPQPRIITPVSDMPGSVESNRALLEQVEKDPTALMSEAERRKYARKEAKPPR